MSENSLFESEYPLHGAAREGDVEELQRLLDERPGEVNQGTFDMVRPLHEACLLGNYDCAVLLLERGAAVNLSNLDGATPICDACFNGNVDLVQLLLEHGAEVNPPLLMTTPAHEAVFRGHTAVLSLLLEHGALVNKSDCHFGTPLHVAASRGETSCAELLLRYGADPRLSQRHQTPLHQAAQCEDFHLIQLLLQYGADVYARNGKGLTARQLLPSSVSSCKDLLLKWEKQASSLKHFCRLTIRGVIPSPCFKNIESLGLPRPLMDYLAFGSHEQLKHHQEHYRMPPIFDLT